MRFTVIGKVVNVNSEEPPAVVGDVLERMWDTNGLFCLHINKNLYHFSRVGHNQLVIQREEEPEEGFEKSLVQTLRFTDSRNQIAMFRTMGG